MENATIVRKAEAAGRPDRVPHGHVLKRRQASESRNGQLKAHKERLKDEVSPSELTRRFRAALTKGVEGIIEAGRVLLEAKKQLKRGQFIAWVVDELRFGEWSQS